MSFSFWHTLCTLISFLFKTYSIKYSVLLLIIFLLLLLLLMLMFMLYNIVWQYYGHNCCVFNIIRYEIYRKILNFICLFGNFIIYLLILGIFVFNQFFVYLFIKLNDNISWFYCCFYGKIILYDWTNLLFNIYGSMLPKIAHTVNVIFERKLWNLNKIILLDHLKLIWDIFLVF